MFSLSRRLLSTRSKDAGRITGRLQTIWIEPTSIREESEIEVHSPLAPAFKVESKRGFSNPYLRLVEHLADRKSTSEEYSYHNPVVETEPKVCELNRRIELLRKQQNEHN